MSLQRRASGLVPDGATFLRRAYHSSVVLDGRVYIDGGEYSYKQDDGDTTYTASSSLLYVDTSESFNTSTVNVHALSKPDDVPSFIFGGSWGDEDSKTLYAGFAGQQSSFTNIQDPPRGLWSYQPDESGQSDGTWKSVSTGAKYIENNPRPVHGLYASGGGHGLYLGGLDRTGGNSSKTSLHFGMTNFDFSGPKTINETVTGILDGETTRKGSMIYTPNFGPNGLFVNVGGVQADEIDGGLKSLLSFNTVRFYDPSTGSWHTQKTTGSYPPKRLEYCLAGATSNSEKTFDILVYAGWAGRLGDEAKPYDTAYVLSLPSFRWFKADYPAENPRHGLRCEHMGGGQILTIGGVNTKYSGDQSYKGPYQAEDPFPQGLGVFDLESMAFTEDYNKDRTEYTPGSQIHSYYQSGPRMPYFEDKALGKLFETQFFASSTDPTSTPSSTSNASADSGPNTGAIAGGVVGGVAGLALIGAGIWFFLRRRRRAGHGGASADGANAAHDKKETQPLATELPAEQGGEGHEMPQWQAHAEAAGSGPRGRSELPPAPAPQELPA